MIAVYLLPVYLLVNGYLLHRIFTWLSAIHPVFRKKAVRIVLGIVYLFVAFSPGIGFLTPPGEAQRFLKGLGYYWMGIMLYMVLVVVAADLIRLVHTKIRKKTFTRLRPALAGALCLILITAVSIYGMVNARWIRITPYQVKVEKQAGDLDSLKIALVADLHLGYSVGTAQMRQMVDKINAQNPDLVVIAGDIFLTMNTKRWTIHKNWLPHSLIWRAHTAPTPAMETTISKSRSLLDSLSTRMEKR